MYKELTEEEKKPLERFPKYEEKLNNWVGSRDYWESIFEKETNRDPELHKAFDELHKKIVDMVLQFCKEHNLTDVDEFYVGADGLMGSIPYGEWCACTDSCMTITKAAEDDHGWIVPNRDEPFLYEI